MRSVSAFLISVAIAIPTSAVAEGPVAGLCGISETTTAGVRRCMLSQQLEAVRAGAVVKGSAAPAVMDATVALDVREQMATMADEREGLMMASAGDNNALFYILPLLLLLALLGAGSSGNGDPISPS